MTHSLSQLWILVVFKINQKYIENNLCINRFDSIPICKGSCFLEQLLRKDQKQQQKYPDLKTNEATVFFESKRLDFLAHPVPLISESHFPLFISSLPPSIYLNSVFRPPSQVI